MRKLEQDGFGFPAAPRVLAIPRIVSGTPLGERGCEGSKKRKESVRCAGGLRGPEQDSIPRVFKGWWYGWRGVRRWITKSTYDKKHQEYADQLQLLEIELSEHRKADHDYQTTVATVISLARRAKPIFENSSEPSEKRAFLNLLLQNPTVNGKKLAFTLASPFNLVLELADSPSWLRWIEGVRTYLV
jgi:hypothetical protein